MSETKLTAEELGALEKAASYYLESGWEMPVDTKDLLSLIAAARELEAAKAQAWDEGRVAGSDMQVDIQQALASVKPMPPPPTNPYRQPKGPTK